MSILRPVGALGMQRIALAPEGRGTSFSTDAMAVLDQCRADVQKLALQYVDTLQELVEARGTVGIVGKNITRALELLGSTETLPDADAIRNNVNAAQVLLLGAQEALKPLMVPKERAEEVSFDDKDIPPAEEGAHALSATREDGVFDPSKLFGDVRFNGCSLDESTKRVTPKDVRTAALRGLEGVELFLAERNPNDALLTIEARRLFDLAETHAPLPNRGLEVLGTVLEGNLRAERDVALHLHAPENTQIVQLANLFLLLRKLMKRGHTTPRVETLEVCVHGPMLIGPKARELMISCFMDRFMSIVKRQTSNPRRLAFSITDDPLRVRERFEETRAPRLPYIPPRRGESSCSAPRHD